MTGIDQLENLPLSQLFSGPLVAAIDASVQAQAETVDLLLDVGYDEKGELQTVTFTYTSPEQDPDTGEYERTPHRLEIPLLLFLKPPNLQIQLIEEEFSARITEVEETTESSSPDRITAPGRLGVKPAGQSVEKDRRRRSKFDLDVRMVAEITNESAGMDLLERAANNQIVDEIEEDSPSQEQSERRYHGVVSRADAVRSPPDEPTDS